MKKELLQKSAAEFIGTFALVFAGTGCLSALAGAEVHLRLLVASIAFGIAIMVMVYAVGHISGAHFNPA